MKKNLILLAILMLVAASLFGQKSKIEQKLDLVKGLSYTSINSSAPGWTCYELSIKQPIDHEDPSKGSFEQRVFLSHRDFSAPTVMVTEGYARDRNSFSEFTVLLNANQLDIEHRFFGKSQPGNIDYQYLTLEQATADLHHINQIFKQIYDGKWLSTGISKGGQTTIFYRYFYPDDVDVSAPYVAPLNLEFEDKRIYQWLDTIGTDECHRRTLEYQKSLLEDRKKMVPKMLKLAKKQELTFTYLEPEEAFEFAVLEFPFSLWQWGHGCENVPDAKAGKNKRLKFLEEVCGFSFWSDGDMKKFASHYYQAASQMGYYGYDTEDFEGLLKALPNNPHPHAAFTPNEMNVDFDGSLLPKVFNWLQTEGDRFIYIYGQEDTWSATGVPPSDKVDAEWFILHGKHHGNARIRSMNVVEKARLMAALERWLAE